MTDRVSISIESHVAEVVLNRPDKFNAIDLKMFDALGEAADQVANDKTLRAVVLRGAGNNFCAGIDLDVFAGGDLDFRAELASKVDPSSANRFQRAAYAWRELPIPVICAVEGVTFGGGMQIALGADLRYAAADAKISIMEAKWGIIPDMGISTTLRGLMAPDHVKELSWSARVMSGVEAQKLGLVTAVVDDPVSTCRQVAADCAARSPNAIRGIKKLVNEAWHLNEADSLELEARLQSDIIGGENQLEAVRANLQKRAPDFKD